MILLALPLRGRAEVRPSPWRTSRLGGAAFSRAMDLGIGRGPGRGARPSGQVSRDFRRCGFQPRRWMGDHGETCFFDRLSISMPPAGGTPAPPGPTRFSIRFPAMGRVREVAPQNRRHSFRTPIEFAGRFRRADAPPTNSPPKKTPPCLLPPSPPCLPPQACRQGAARIRLPDKNAAPGKETGAAGRRGAAGGKGGYRISISTSPSEASSVAVSMGL